MPDLSAVQAFIDDASGQAAAWVTALRGPTTQPIITPTSTTSASLAGLFANPLLFVVLLVVIVLLLRA